MPYSAAAMTMRDIGPLLAADEGLNHQIADTFGAIAESDLSWTEKIWVSVARTDGSLQVDFGLGKYHNRGVLDGFGGVSCGKQQWTVRASRELASAPEAASVGPLHYEVIEPMRTVRVRLEPSDVQPISFDVVLSAVLPPFLEERNLMRNATSARVDMDVVRYHQGGWATGTVSVDGETHQLGGEEWFGYRDHSWGVRATVGVAPSDLPPPRGVEGIRRTMMKWSPAFLHRPDGTCYEVAVFHNVGPWTYSSAYVNEADGHQARAYAFEPNLTYDPVTRFVRGGEIRLRMEDGQDRLFTVEALGSSGFFLRAGGYGAWKGHAHGSWQGPLVVEGEHVSDCWDDEHRRSLGQLRDTPIRVREGDAVGYGIMESMLFGDWPEFGLVRQH